MEVGNQKLHIPNVICLTKCEQKCISIKMSALQQRLFFDIKMNMFK